jgi:hypothetical protein
MPQNRRQRDVIDPATEYNVVPHPFPRFLWEWVGKNVTVFLAGSL